MLYPRIAVSFEADTQDEFGDTMNIDIAITFAIDFNVLFEGAFTYTQLTPARTKRVL